jgi:hypothetical protein
MADKPGWVVPMFATRIEAVEFRKSMLLLGVEVIRDPWVARGAQSRIREVLLLREYFKLADPTVKQNDPLTEVLLLGDLKVLVLPESLLPPSLIRWAELICTWKGKQAPISEGNFLLAARFLLGFGKQKYGSLEGGKHLAAMMQLHRALINFCLGAIKAITGPRCEIELKLAGGNLEVFLNGRPLALNKTEQRGMGALALMSNLHIISMRDFAKEFCSNSEDRGGRDFNQALKDLHLKIPGFGWPRPKVRNSRSVQGIVFGTLPSADLLREWLKTMSIHGKQAPP